MRTLVLCLIGASMISQQPAAQAVAPPASPAQIAALKNVRVLATGGTIAGSAPAISTDYRAGVVPVSDILRSVPGLNDIANISSEQIANIDSDDMDEGLWRKLLSRVQSAVSDPQVAGVVITHGTDTLEETAYFLSLVLPSSKPVVLVGSMRPGTAVSPDGPQNLLDAVRVASADQAQDRGVLVVMNDTIFDPASVTKVDVRRLNAFGAPSRGPIGEVLTDRPVFFESATNHGAAFTLQTRKLPRVAIAYAYAGLSGDDLRKVVSGANGLIIAGAGAGGFSTSARKVVRELASKGFPIVRTARQGVGDVWRSEVGDSSDAALGTIAGRELTPPKARILLMLALQSKRTREELQSLFDRFGTGER